MNTPIDGIINGKRSTGDFTNISVNISGLSRFADASAMIVLRHRHDKTLKDLHALTLQLWDNNCNFPLALESVEWDDQSMSFAILMAYGELLRLSKEPAELQFRFDRAYRSYREAGVFTDEESPPERAPSQPGK